MKLIDLDEKEKVDLLNEFYKYFETGYEFENFLKVYLQAIGLDEIEVTQKSRDNGVDLKAVKNGIDELSDLDEVKYYIQAKRYKPGSSVSIKDVRELRGVLPSGYKGVFISTGKFSKDAYTFAKEQADRPIILIDGKTLIENCIDKGIGFMAKPIFSKESLDRLMKIDRQAKESQHGNIEYIRKNISKNDIRARILPIPNSIYEKLDENKASFPVQFDGEKLLELNINRNRKYFGGITEIYKKFGLIEEGNIFIEKTGLWNYDGEKTIVKFE